MYRSTSRSKTDWSHDNHLSFSKLFVRNYLISKYRAKRYRLQALIKHRYQSISLQENQMSSTRRFVQPL